MLSAYPLQGRHAGTAVTVNASQFLRSLVRRFKNLQSAITVNDTATAFAAVFNAQLVEAIAQAP